MGSILFILYPWRFCHVAEKHLPNIQCYADDTQLYLSFRSDLTTSQDKAVLSMERCISDIRAWITNNYLKLNDTKTEFLVIGSHQQLIKIKIDSVRVGSTESQKVSSVRNLGARFEACSKGFFSLHKIRQTRKFLSEKATATLIHTFITSHLDYCNSLLYRVP